MVQALCSFGASRIASALVELFRTRPQPALSVASLVVPDAHVDRIGESAACVNQ